MSKIRVKEVKVQLEVSQDQMQLIVDGLSAYCEKMINRAKTCTCADCQYKDKEAWAREILDIYFEIYPLSKLGKFATGIPKLDDIRKAMGLIPDDADTEALPNSIDHKTAKSDDAKKVSND